MRYGITCTILHLCAIAGIRAQFALSLGAGLGGVVDPPELWLPDQLPDVSVSARDAVLAYDATFAAGFNTRMRFDYSLSRHLQLDLDVSYATGGGVVRVQDPGSGNHTETLTRSPKLRVSPAVTLGTGWRIFDPYLRVGLLLPARNTVRFTQTLRTPVQLREQEIEARGHLSTGLTGGLGMRYRLGRRVQLFYECEYMLRGATLHESTLVAYRLDGADYLASLQGYQISTIFVPELGPDSNHPSQPGFDPSLPLETTRTSRSAGSLQINFGVMVGLDP